MKPKKPFDEAIMRAKQTTDKEAQTQEQLFAMHQEADGNNAKPVTEQQSAPINESHQRLMQSWHNLRDLDSKLADDNEDIINYKSDTKKEEDKI